MCIWIPQLLSIEIYDGTLGPDWCILIISDWFTSWWQRSIPSISDQSFLVSVYLVPPPFPGPARRHSKPSGWRSPCCWWPENPLFRSGIAPWRRPAYWISQHCAWLRERVVVRLMIIITCSGGGPQYRRVSCELSHLGPALQLADSSTLPWSGSS